MNHRCEPPRTVLRTQNLLKKEYGKWLITAMFASKLTEGFFAHAYITYIHWDIPRDKQSNLYISVASRLNFFAGQPQKLDRFGQNLEF